MVFKLASSCVWGVQVWRTSSRCIRRWTAMASVSRSTVCEYRKSVDVTCYCDRWTPVSLPSTSTSCSTWRPPMTCSSCLNRYIVPRRLHFLRLVVRGFVVQQVVSLTACCTTCWFACVFVVLRVVQQIRDKSKLVKYGRNSVTFSSVLIFFSVFLKSFYRDPHKLEDQRERSFSVVTGKRWSRLLIQTTTMFQL